MLPLVLGMPIAPARIAMRYSDPFDLVGTVIDHKYLVEAVVGEGGFSVVYRAMHLMWKRPVAIKAFRFGHVALGERDSLVEAFVREGALLAELSERSIAICQARDVATLTTAKGDWVPYLVLEWLEGETLEAWMARKRAEGARLSIEEAIALLGPAVDALSIAHSAGIAHRDIKPANLFIVGQGRAIKLVDFGIAKVVRDAQQRISLLPREDCSYTPAFGAPEQVAPVLGQTGPWTDVFALALIFVEVMSGREALTGRDVESFARASLDPGGRPTPRARGAHVSDAVEAVFKRALSVRPSDRQKTARHFLDELRAAMAVPLSEVALAAIDSRPPADRTIPPVVVPSMLPEVWPPQMSSGPSGPSGKRASKRRSRLGATLGAIGFAAAVGSVAFVTRVNLVHSFAAASASPMPYAIPAPVAAMPLPPMVRSMSSVDAGVIQAAIAR